MGRWFLFKVEWYELLNPAKSEEKSNGKINLIQKNQNSSESWGSVQWEINFLVIVENDTYTMK